MNKKQKTERCRGILYSYNLNEEINRLNDYDFLISIFENHSEWDLKKGVGIKSISVVKNKFNKCFQINRVDGTFTDISFVHSISQTSDISKIKKACRGAVRGEVLKYRNENVFFGVTKCPINGEFLTKENTHIDHYDITFNDMFELWFKNQNLKNLVSKLNDTKDNCVDTFFTDDSIINDFIIFHNENCKLRAVSSIANLSILKVV